MDLHYYREKAGSASGSSRAWSILERRKCGHEAFIPLYIASACYTFLQATTLEQCRLDVQSGHNAPWYQLYNSFDIGITPCLIKRDDASLSRYQFNS